MSLDRIKSALPGEGGLREKLIAIVGNMSPSVRRACWRELTRQLIHNNRQQWGRPAPGEGRVEDVSANLISEIEQISGRRVS